jgi:hypothetical protein
VFASFLQDDSTLVRSVILSLQQRMRSWATTPLPTLPLSKMQLEKSISDCRLSSFLPFLIEFTHYSRWRLWGCITRSWGPWAWRRTHDLSYSWVPIFSKEVWPKKGFLVSHQVLWQNLEWSECQLTPPCEL